jgi:hypothetical protein
MKRTFTSDNGTRPTQKFCLGERSCCGHKLGFPVACSFCLDRRVLRNLALVPVRWLGFVLLPPRRTQTRPAGLRRGQVLVRRKFVVDRQDVRLGSVRRTFDQGSVSPTDRRLADLLVGVCRLLFGCFRIGFCLGENRTEAGCVCHTPLLLARWRRLVGLRRCLSNALLTINLCFECLFLTRLECCF